MTTQESRDPDTLAAFAFEFPPAPIGTPPCVAMLQLRNNGLLPVRVDFQLPTERDCAVEPWAEEMDEPTEDEFNDNELIGRNIMGVYPRTLFIQPGAAAGEGERSEPPKRAYRRWRGEIMADGKENGLPLGSSRVSKEARGHGK